MRYKGLVLGWVLFSLCPLMVSAVSDTSMFWLTAMLAAMSSVAHLSSQQMYDAYLPLLAKSHWKTRAVAAGGKLLPDSSSSGGGGGDESKSCCSVFGVGAAGATSAFHAGGASGGAARNMTGMKDVGGGGGWEKTGGGGGGDADNTAPGGAGVGAGAGTGAGSSEEDGLPLIDRVERMRQSVASELAFVAPSLGFISLFAVTIIQLGKISSTHVITPAVKSSVVSSLSPPVTTTDVWPYKPWLVIPHSSASRLSLLKSSAL